MENTSQSECSCANPARRTPSFVKRACSGGAVRARRIPLQFGAPVMSLAIILGACVADTPKPAPQAEAKPAVPAIPEDIQSAGQAVFGRGSRMPGFFDP